MTERISYADAEGNTGSKPVPLLDRAFGAALAFFGMVMTLALAPVILAIGIPGLAGFQHPFFRGDCGKFLSGVGCGSRRRSLRVG